MSNKYTLTSKLIIFNVIVYLITLLFPGLVYYLFALHTFSSGNFSPIQLVSYQFIHDTGPLHIIFNMMILYVFGTFVENHYGSKKMLFFYLLSGVFAGILHNLTISEELKIMSFIRNEDLTLVGASGSVWGILALFTLLFPNELLYLFFLPIGVKAKWVISIFFLIEVFSIFLTSDNVSHFAHIGGALTGVAIYLYHQLKK